jgi:hypothetical protein
MHAYACVYDAYTIHICVYMRMVLRMKTSYAVHVLHTQESLRKPRIIRSLYASYANVCLIRMHTQCHTQSRFDLYATLYKCIRKYCVCTHSYAVVNFTDDPTNVTAVFFFWFLGIFYLTTSTVAMGFVITPINTGSI